MASGAPSIYSEITGALADEMPLASASEVAVAIIEGLDGGPAFERQFYGAAAKLQDCEAPEVILSGPAETGKTLACLYRLDQLAWKHAGMQAVIVRKTRQSMGGSVLQTYERKVLGKGSPVKPFGGKKPEWYDYPNGSRIFVGGMDDPDKVLSSERDLVYVNQAEELTIDDWEKLTTRATGRAGNMPFAQVMADCNPGPAHHWILDRARTGRLLMLESRHRDNPTLYDPSTGRITEQGKLSMAVLDALTGVRKDRLKDGRWVNAEGAVYDFDAALHLIDPFEIPASWRRVLAVDFGYTNPFVCQWWAIDHDGRMYLYREIYMSRRLVEEHAKQILDLSAGETIEAAVADHDAEDRATLAAHGLPTVPARKEIGTGIQAVQGRLKVAGDKRPRLYVFRGATVEIDEELRAKHQPVSTEQEFDVYMWPKAADGKPVKEIPVDANNHGMDTSRYAVMYVDQGSPGPAEVIQTPAAVSRWQTGGQREDERDSYADYSAAPQSRWRIGR